MKFLPKISIIMNCYNGEKYLNESLNSILKQTYKNWEVIFFDNKSTDNSKKIFKKIKDKRFKYFRSKKKLTLYTARNYAVKKAKGSYISFLDVDDLWVKNKLYKQMNLINKKKSSFVFSNCYILSKKKKITFIKKKYKNRHITQDLLNNYNVPILTVIFKKNLLKKYKLSFNKKYNVIGDLDLFMKLSKNIMFDYIHEPLAIYRLHSNNYSQIHHSKHNEELSFWFKKNKKIFNDFNFDSFLINLKYRKIKSDIYENKYQKALINFIKFPLSLKKIKLFFHFFILKKNYNLS